MTKKTVDFGFKEVPYEDKARHVAGVFSSVAQNYDVMNDVMSMGIHRYWKRYAIAGTALNPGSVVLDLAGGSGDLSALIAKRVGPDGRVFLTDINPQMLEVGRRRLIDQGFAKSVNYVLVDAERIPFPDNFFDCITIGFGLRNVTDKERALKSMYRVLRPGGNLMVLEFSKPTSSVLSKLYDFYSFQMLPRFGAWIAKDAESYRYLAESIRMHPDQETLKQMIQEQGFEDCRYKNLNGGIVAIHRAFKY